MKTENEVFMRIDLKRTSTGATLYYRLPKEVKDYLNKCEKKHEIEAIILTRRNGKYYWNMGFVIKEISPKL